MPKKDYIHLVEKNGYQYVERLIGQRGAVVIIPCIEKNCEIYLQLILSTRPTFDKPILEMPAGLLEDDELIEDCIYRELKEETGWTCEISKIFDPSPSSAGLSNELLHIALVKLKEQTNPNFQGDEKITILPLMTAQQILNYIEQNKDIILVSSRLVTYIIGFSIGFSTK